jgi:uncharacterized protein (TIGR00369 family)
VTTPLTTGTPVGPLGFVPRAAAPGTATWEYDVKREHFNPNGVLHGGVVMALLDTAMGQAVAALVAPEGAFNASAQMNVHFLEPIRGGRVTARAEVRKCGKRLAVVEAEATDEHGMVLAIATASHAILRRTPEPPASERDHS